jgi:hypothetical protein
MLRVIQWATGSVGRLSVAAVHEHPELELVGALVYSDAKAGRDVGDLCGIGPIGVKATKDPDEILALDADCVLYMPARTKPIRAAWARPCMRCTRSRRCARRRRESVRSLTFR